jgi:hypothetical protein
MVRTIVDHVAALAEALEITQPVIARVVIEVRCSQDDTGLPQLRCFFEIGPPGRPAAAIAPGVTGASNSGRRARSQGRSQAGRQRR